MPQTSSSHDSAYFDGSADPNPGGRMGLGWRILYRGGSERTGAAEHPPASGNTNNVAEYVALIAALEEYSRAGGQGPLLVHGDSQLVIRQMTGAWGINSPPLSRLNQQARQIASLIPGGVRFLWVPREQNWVADQLASGVASGAMGPLVYAATPSADVPAPLAKQIAALNATGRASFKECIRLRVGGYDAFSALRLPSLAVKAGPECVALCEEAFPGDAPGSIREREAALRWMLRGLAAQLAIRQVQVDREVSRNTQQRR